jgi:hypothetical protein
MGISDIQYKEVDAFYKSRLPCFYIQCQSYLQG